MRRNKRFGLLLSQEEKRALAWLARSEGGLSQAATLRRLIRKEALALGFRLLAADQRAAEAVQESVPEVDDQGGRAR